MPALDFVNPVLAPGGPEGDAAEPTPTQLELSKDELRAVCPHPKYPGVMACMQKVVMKGKDPDPNVWPGIQVGICWLPTDKQRFLEGRGFRSILETIHLAPSLAILDAIMDYYALAEAKGKTKERWVAAANARHMVLEAQGGA